jgi:hypothetical protein
VSCCVVSLNRDGGKVVMEPVGGIESCEEKGPKVRDWLGSVERWKLTMTQGSTSKMVITRMKQRKRVRASIRCV